MIVANHPKAGGSHLPDITVITPVRLVSVFCFVLLVQLSLTLFSLLVLMRYRYFVFLICHIEQVFHEGRPVFYMATGVTTPTWVGSAPVPCRRSRTNWSKRGPPFCHTNLSKVRLLPPIVCIRIEICSIHFNTGGCEVRLAANNALNKQTVCLTKRVLPIC